MFAMQNIIASGKRCKMNASAAFSRQKMIFLAKCCDKLRRTCCLWDESKSYLCRRNQVLEIKSNLRLGNWRDFTFDNSIGKMHEWNFSTKILKIEKVIFSKKTQIRWGEMRDFRNNCGQLGKRAKAWALCTGISEKICENFSTIRSEFVGN